MWVQSLGQEDPLEEGMATHSSILAWRIPWTEEPGGLQSIEKSQTQLKQLSMHAFHYSIPNLLSVAAERVTKGGLDKHGLPDRSPDRTGLTNRIFCHNENIYYNGY